MPPAASKQQSKRKAPDTTPEADDTAVETPEQIAKRAFAGIVARVGPAPIHTSIGGNTCTIEGVVLRTSKSTVQGKTGSVPKLNVTIGVTKVMASACKDVVSGEGVAFLLPTKTLDASPEELARDANAKGKTVLDLKPGVMHANYLGTFSTSFYTDGPAAGAKGPVTAGPEACVVGSRVLVTGVSGTFGKTGSDGRLFSNAKKIMPTSEPPQPFDAAASIIEAASGAGVQATSALLWSCASRGHFESSYDDARGPQAEACRNKWGSLVTSLAARVEYSLGQLDEQKDAELTGVLRANADRLKSVSGLEAASGTQLFSCDLDKDCPLPFYAPLVQRGVSPQNGMPSNCTALFDPELRKSLHGSFVDAALVSVSFKGNLCQLDYRLFAVFDTAAAIEAVVAGQNPVLATNGAAACVKLSKRSIGQELIGTNHPDLIETVCKEILPFANQAIFANVFPRADGDSLDGFFANTSGIDLVDGIRKAGAAVSQEWLDKTFLGGRGVYIYKIQDGVQMVEPSSVAGPVPELKKNGYQLCSQSSFDFDSLGCPEGKAVQYKIVYAGCSAHIAKDADLATSVEAGETRVAAVAAENGIDIKTFLREQAAVYAIAV
jgi:hypothetical protein